MKTIDVKSMLIGFLLCAVGFLTIGATDNNGYGKYQVSTATFASDISQRNIYVTVIDTQTGRVHSRKKYKESTYK